MTAIMVLVGMWTRTPTAMWYVAMGCDTTMACVYMLTHWHS